VRKNTELNENGYHINQNENQITENDKEIVNKTLMKYIPNIKLDPSLDVIKTVLPFEYSAHFSNLMEDLESNGYNLSIEICSLEDA